LAYWNCEDISDVSLLAGPRDPFAIAAQMAFADNLGR
jgi:hypothetical protein